MIKLKEKTEKMVQKWAESRDLTADEMIEKIVKWALYHAPKNLDEFDEYGLPYVSKEEEEDLSKLYGSKDYSKEEEYTQEEVDKILGLKE